MPIDVHYHLVRHIFVCWSGETFKQYRSISFRSNKLGHIILEFFFIRGRDISYS